MTVCIFRETEFFFAWQKEQKMEHLKQGIFTSFWQILNYLSIWCGKIASMCERKKMKDGLFSPFSKKKLIIFFHHMYTGNCVVSHWKCEILHNFKRWNERRRKGASSIIFFFLCQVLLLNFSNIWYRATNVFVHVEDRKIVFSHQVTVQKNFQS